MKSQVLHIQCVLCAVTFLVRLQDKCGSLLGVKELKAIIGRGSRTNFRPSSYVCAQKADKNPRVFL